MTKRVEVFRGRKLHSHPPLQIVIDTLVATPSLHSLCREGVATKVSITICRGGWECNFLPLNTSTRFVMFHKSKCAVSTLSFLIINHDMILSLSKSKQVRNL